MSKEELSKIETDKPVQGHAGDKPGQTTDDLAKQKADVVNEMTSEPYRFDFFQAVRRIEGLNTDAPRVGRSVRVAHERVRISQSASLDFAPATLEKANSIEDGRIQIAQRFFGLWGPSGPLPLHMTEAARHQLRHEDDPTQVAFADLFHHRMAVLFYRIWSESRGAVQRDRPDQDRFADFVSSLAGGLQQKDISKAKQTNEDLADLIAKDVQRFFAGRFGVRRNAEGLRAIVSESFRVQTNVVSFVPKQICLRQEDYSRLGSKNYQSIHSKDEQQTKLGESLVLGRRIHDRTSTVELQLGPLKIDEFLGLQPGELPNRVLQKLTKQFVGIGIDIQVRLILNRREWAKTKLGQFGTLGRSTWLQSQPPKREADQYAFRL